MKGLRVTQFLATVVAGLSLLVNGSLALFIKNEFPEAVLAIPVLYGAGALHALVAFLVLNHTNGRLSSAEQTRRTALRLRVLAQAGWASAVLLALQIATGGFGLDGLGTVVGCSPFVATAIMCGVVWRRLTAAPAMQRGLKWAIAALVAAFLAYGFRDLVLIEADNWASMVVKKVKGPLRITVVNTTDTMHEVEVGAGGFTCHISCLKPGKRGLCEPEYYGSSLLRVRLPQAGFLEESKVRFEDLPVAVLWSSHGTVEVYVTDAGFVVDGGFSTDFF